MARSSAKGSQRFLLLALLGMLAGAGAWNYQRNLEIEKAEPRPYRSYSLGELEELQAAYQHEVDARTARYRTAASRQVKVRQGGLIGDQVDEFERVQRISRGKRALASEYAKSQVRLDGVVAEITRRASEGPAWKRFLTRLTKYP